MVAQVLSNARKVCHDCDAFLLKMLRRPDSGQHEDLRGCDGPCGENDLPGFHPEYLAAALHLQSSGPPIFNESPAHENVGADGQVESVAVGVYVGEGRAHPHPIRIIHGERAKPCGVRVVVIVNLGVSLVQAGRLKSMLQGQPVFGFVAHNRDRTIRTMKVILDVCIGL